MKQFTFEDVLKLYPCSKYRENKGEYSKQLFAGRTDINLIDVLEMDIPTDDKIWLSVRIMSRRQRVMFAALCALNVECYFRAEFPNDCRVYNAAMTMVNCAETNDFGAARDAAQDAARDAAQDAAWDAARAAAWAAWAAARDAAWDAARAAWAARDAAWAAETYFQLLLIADIATWFDVVD